MLFRTLLTVLSVAVLLVAGVSGQCPVADTQALCSDLVSTQPSGDFIQLTFQFDTATGQICSITSGSIIVPASSAFPAGRSVIIPAQTLGAGNTVTVSQVNGVDQATNINVNFVDINGIAGKLGPTATATTATALITGHGAFAFLQYSPFTITEQINNAETMSGPCTGTTFGDPHFIGFHGQQFCLRGQPNSVINLIQDTFMQINTRLLQVEVGEAMNEREMKLVRLASGNKLPYTHWFDHEGPYMGELGVVMPEGHRMFAKAGPYLTGWAVVRIDDQDLQVSEQPVVVGYGDQAISFTRLNANQIRVESHYVDLIFTNSDNFFNIEGAHAERTYERRPLGGALGQTSDRHWKSHWFNTTWEAQIEKELTLASGDLFELSATPVTVSKEHLHSM